MLKASAIGPAGAFLMRVRWTASDAAHTGQITTWRRTGGKRWVVTYYDLGEWTAGDPDPDGDLRQPPPA